MDKEKLEEAAEKSTQLWFNNNAFTKELFIEGAKWMQERMYSEEDLFKILLDFVAFPHEHMEPRGSIIERYLKELKNK